MSEEGIEPSGTRVLDGCETLGTEFSSRAVNTQLQSNLSSPIFELKKKILTGVRGKPGFLYVVLSVLKLSLQSRLALTSDLPTYASLVLGLKVCAAVPGYF